MAQKSKKWKNKMPQKAKKKRNAMPPLSLTDKLIYWTVFVLLCAVWFGSMFGFLYLRHKIDFSDQAVIAVHDHASMLWFLVPWITFFLMTLILWMQPYQNRTPIIGQKYYRYGAKDSPAFMKKKPPIWVGEKKKKEQKRLSRILLAILLISFIPFPWSLYGRDGLLQDGSIVQYNMFYHQTHEFSSDDIADVEIATFHYLSGKYSTTRHWGVKMSFKTDSGKKYTFEYRSFRKESDAETRSWLVWMLNIKKCYDPGIIHYDGMENMEQVIADGNLSQEEIQQLYQLFGRP